MSIFDVNVAFTSLSLPASVGGCIALAGTYVLSLYVVSPFFYTRFAERRHGI